MIAAEGKHKAATSATAVTEMTVTLTVIAVTVTVMTVSVAAGAAIEQSIQAAHTSLQWQRLNACITKHIT